MTSSAATLSREKSSELLAELNALRSGVALATDRGLAFDARELARQAGDVARLLDDRALVQYVDLDRAYLALLFDANPGPVLQVATSLLRAPATSGVRWLATLALAEAESLDGTGTSALQRLDELVPELEAAGDAQVKTLGEALLFRGRAALLLGRARAAASDLLRSESIARSAAALTDAVRNFGGDAPAARSRQVRTELDARSTRGLALACDGELVRGESLLRDALATAATEKGAREVAVEADARLRAVLLRAGKADEALAGWRASADRARALGAKASWRHVLEVAAASSASLGRIDEARDLVELLEGFDAFAGPETAERLRRTSPLLLLGTR